MDGGQAFWLGATLQETRRRGLVRKRKLAFAGVVVGSFLIAFVLVAAVVQIAG